MRALLLVLLSVTACAKAEAPIPPQPLAPVAEGWPEGWPATGVLVMPPGETNRDEGVYIPGPSPDIDKAPLWRAADLSEENLAKIDAAHRVAAAKDRAEGRSRFIE